MTLETEQNSIPSKDYFYVFIQRLKLYRTTLRTEQDSIPLLDYFYVFILPLKLFRLNPKTKQSFYPNFACWGVAN